MVAAAEAEEKRIDPEDGKSYTLAELKVFYKNTYGKKDILAYWEGVCTTVKGTKAKAKAKTKEGTAKESKAKGVIGKLWQPKDRKDPKGKAAGTWHLIYHQAPFKGRAEFIRLMFEDAGVAFKESGEGLYGADAYCDAFRVRKSGEDAAPNTGFYEKVEKDTAPFPVMFPPILHYKPAGNEKEVFINQVPAIMRYAAAQLGYLPRGSVQTALADCIMENATDFIAEGRRSFHPVADSLGYKDQKEEADKESKAWSETRLPIWLGNFEKVVKKLRPDADGPLLGRRMTYADFALFHILDAAEQQFNTDHYNQAFEQAPVPTLKKWKAWVAARPKLAEYLASDRRKPWAGDSLM